jgi:hypothetical protein
VALVAIAISPFFRADFPVFLETPDRTRGFAGLSNMDNELQQRIESLESQIEALTSERIPKVDRASKRRDKRQVFAGFGLFAVALLVAGTMSASALSGSNTVLSDDIKDTEVHGSDINSNAVTGAKVKDDTLTGADVKESTLAIPKVLITKVAVNGPSVVPVVTGAATSAEAFAGGTVRVTFPASVPIPQCTVVATTGGVPGGGWSSGSNASINPLDHTVDVYMTLGTAANYSSFNLVLIC